MKCLNLIAICLTSSISWASAPLNFGNINGNIDKLHSWKDLRDDKIVKQDWDYSCGPAAAATILNSFYGENISEEDILEKVIKSGGDGTASFHDLQQAVMSFGYKGVGVSITFEKLKSLAIPAIVYLNYRDDDHFSVIRGISADGMVWLADSSLGNRRFSESQFKAMWETRDDNNLKGKMLLIIPNNKSQADINNDFFGSPQINQITIERLKLRL